MADSRLFSLAGQGQGSAGLNIAGGLGGAMSGIGSGLMFVNPLAGGAALGAGALTNLITGAIKGDYQKRQGERMYGQAQTNMANKIAANPNMYSLDPIKESYKKSERDLRGHIAKTNSDLYNKYDAVQRRVLQNRLRSGLTAGAAAAQNVQQNVAFQQQANKMFQDQAGQISQIELRKRQALMNAAPLIEERKSNLARQSLVGAGISNPMALGGLTQQLKGGY